MTATVSQNVSIRQNFDETSEDMLNKLVNLIFNGNYTFHQMAYYFEQVDIALIGFADLFKLCAIRQYKVVRKIMDYIVLRGGEVEFDVLNKPEKTKWGTPLEAVEYLLNYKKCINEFALKVHNYADEKEDPSLTDFLEEEVLQHYTTAIRKIGILITNLRVAGQGLGEYQVNKHLKIYLEKVYKEQNELPDFKSFL